MSDILQDPLALAEQVIAAGAAAEAEYYAVTRKLFTTATGRRWLVLAMARFNFMGGSFSPDDSYNVAAAACREGARGVFSEILNAVAAAKQQTPEEDD